LKKAIMIGVAGQDGAYLAQYLLQIGYEVIGLHRSLELNNLWRLQQLGILNHIQVLHFDLNNPSTLKKILLHHRPDELYNLGGITSVADSFRNPNLCYQINITVKYFHAASSEMFGANPASNLDENSTFHPVSPYGISKVFAYHNTSLYRHNYGLPIGVGIAFNHESPLRGQAFFSAKIIQHVQQLNGEKDSSLEVG
jgi:GDPmannose 4,6-dehydratase